MQLEHVGMSRQRKKESKAHSHNAWELIYNAQGSGVMTVGGEEHPFDDATVLLCPPGTLHEKYAEDGFTDYYFTFYGCELPPYAYVLRDSYDRRLLQLIRVLHSAYYEETSPSVCDHLVEAILGLIKPLLIGQQIDVHVQMLRQRIAQGHADPAFSLGSAMAEVPLNADHLRRLFVRQLGLTPHDYLQNLRLDKAKRLLTESYVSVADVAYRCGFYDPLYFSKVFRKATGVPPSSWR